jgi:segregation and condensation protein A
MNNPILINQQELFELPQDLYIPPEALQVFLEMFEGPLDLLLYMIRKQNLDIREIPITKITDQYISYINAMQILNIELAGEYLLMAAMLLEIKSRMLLPPPARTADDPDEALEDPRQELIRRLIEYEQIKIASAEINKIPQAERDYRWLEVFSEDTPLEPPQVTISQLQKAWHTLLIRSLGNQSQHHMKKQELSVREHMSQILRLLQQSGRSNFFTLFSIEMGTSHVVVNFIAILELGKEGMITIMQDEQQNIFVDLAA